MYWLERMFPRVSICETIVEFVQQDKPLCSLGWGGTGGGVLQVAASQPYVVKTKTLKERKKEKPK